MKSSFPRKSWCIATTTLILRCALLCVIITFASSALADARNTPKVSISYLGCRGPGAERNMQLDADFVLYQQFLEPNRELEAQLRDAATWHIYYLRGYLASRGSSFELAWSTDVPEITIKQVSQEKYPLDLTIDASYDPNVKVVNPYVRAAIATGHTQRGGPALRIKYSVTWKVVVCAGRPAEIEQVKFALPFDPYLMYWAVKPSDRRPRHYGNYRGIVNPCVTDSFMIYPDGYYVWYFWRFDESGKDDLGKPFQCTNLLLPERDFFYFTAKLLPGGAPHKRGRVFQVDRMPRARPLRITALFGMLDAKQVVLNFDELMEFTRNRVALRAFINRLEESYPADSTNDSGAEYFRDFVNGVSDLVIPNTSTVEADQPTGVLTLRGKLRRSGRAVEISLFYGQTDLLTTTAVQHWKPFLSFLEHGDILIYMGHAGLGENVRVDNLMKALKLTGEGMNEKLGQSPDYQLLAYFSCYSYSYFGEDVVARRRSAKQGSTTDILFTAMDYGSALGGLAIIDYVDRYLARTRGFRPGDLTNPLYVSEDEFLVVKSFE